MGSPRVLGPHRGWGRGHFPLQSLVGAGRGHGDGLRPSLPRCHLYAKSNWAKFLSSHTYDDMNDLSVTFVPFTLKEDLPSVS